MESITLDEAKGQCSVDLDFDGHDDRLERLILAAEQWAIQYCNLESLEDFAAESPPEQLPEDVKSALLLHVEWEFDRDPGAGHLLKRAEDLLWPHRIGLGV